VDVDRGHARPDVALMLHCSCTVAALLPCWLACCAESGGRSRNRGYLIVLSHGEMGRRFRTGYVQRRTGLREAEGRDARRVVRKGVMPHDEQPQQTAGTGRGERL
jgi:hypothetical protein